MNLMRDWRAALREYIADYYGDVVAGLDGAALRAAE
jgi:hypothetical protein